VSRLKKRIRPASKTSSAERNPKARRLARENEIANRISTPNEREKTMSARRIAFGLVMAWATAASADHTYNPQHRGDQREASGDRRELRDDYRDLKELRELQQRFERARASHRMREIFYVDREVTRILREESFEAGVEQRRAAYELRRSEAELRDTYGRPQPAFGNPARFHARDDRRDRNDDAQDLRKQWHTRNMIQRISAEWDSLRYRRDRYSLSRRSELLGQMVSLARWEIRDDRIEVREDRQERREDNHNGWRTDRR
jgi:hypothetical protein